MNDLFFKTLIKQRWIAAFNKRGVNKKKIIKPGTYVNGVGILSTMAMPLGEALKVINYVGDINLFPHWLKVAVDFLPKTSSLLVSQNCKKYNRPVDTYSSKDEIISIAREIENNPNFLISNLGNIMVSIFTRHLIDGQHRLLAAIYAVFIQKDLSMLDKIMIPIDFISNTSIVSLIDTGTEYTIDLAKTNMLEEIYTSQNNQANAWTRRDYLNRLENSSDATLRNAYKTYTCVYNYIKNASGRTQVFVITDYLCDVVLGDLKNADNNPSILRLATNGQQIQARAKGVIDLLMKIQSEATPKIDSKNYLRFSGNEINFITLFTQWYDDNINKTVINTHLITPDFVVKAVNSFHSDKDSLIWNRIFDEEADFDSRLSYYKLFIFRTPEKKLTNCQAREMFARFCNIVTLYAENN